jgi:hypothetical protein
MAKSLVANELIKEGPLSFGIHKSHFVAVSTVSRGHPSLPSYKIALMLEPFYI